MLFTRRWMGWILLLMWLGSASAAETGGRVALVIGNGGYTALKSLPNPKKDAAAVARALKGLGYRLVDRDGKPTDKAELDLDQQGLFRAVNALAQAAQGQEIAFLYYAGHGFQDGANSYLVPVDAPKPERADDLDILKSRSIALDRVLGKVDGKAQLMVAVFDACREIPELNTAVRASGLGGDNNPYQGLLPVYRGGIRDPAGQATRTSRLIAYAGAAGQLVKDGAGEHSPYTELLLDQLQTVLQKKDNVELTTFFQGVAWSFRDQHDQQQPLLEVAAKPNTFYLLPGSIVIMPPPADYDLTAWQSAEKCGTAACYEAYRKAHPQGRFIELAKAQIDKLAPKPKVDTPPVEDLARKKELDIQLAAVRGLLKKGNVAGARQALEDAKRWDRQGQVEAFRREETAVFQAMALAFLEKGQTNQARRVVEDLGRWDPQALEYQVLWKRLAE